MTRARWAVLVGLLVLAALAVTGWLAWRQGAEWLRATLEAELQQYLVPLVRIEGPVAVSLRPQVALAVGGLTLSDETGQTLLAVREIEAVFDQAELFGDTPRIESLTISGLELMLTRDADGRWNVEGWLREPPGGADGTADFMIGRVVVDSGDIRIAGEPALSLRGVRVEAGPITPGASGAARVRTRAVMEAPFAVDLGLDAQTDYRWHAGGANLESPRLAFSGEAGGWRFEKGDARAAEFRWSADAGMQLRELAVVLVAHAAGTLLDADLRLAALDAREARWEGESLMLALRAAREAHTLEADLASPAPALDSSGAWQLPRLTLRAASGGSAPKLRLALDGELAGGQADAAPEVDAEPPAPVRLAIGHAALELPHPAGEPAPLALSLSGAAGFDPAAGVASGALTGDFDESRFDGRFRYVPAAARPLVFELSLDRLDLDAYLPPPRDDGGPIDLAAWRAWPVEADLRIGVLRFQDMTAEDARLRLTGGE